MMGVGLRRRRKMRGYDRPQTTMLTLVNPEKRVPANPDQIDQSVGGGGAERTLAVVRTDVQ
jgi:hypothetical protein